MSEQRRTDQAGPPHRCALCRTPVGECGDAIEFVPRAVDLEWHDVTAGIPHSDDDDMDRLRTAVDAAGAGDAPDVAWLCARHVAAGRVAATRFDIDEGLHFVALADQGVDVTGRLPAAVRVDQWGRLLRRAMVDLAIELGNLDLERDDGAQETYYPMAGSPDTINPFTWTESWVVAGDAGTVCVYTERADWYSGPVARLEAVVMVTPGYDDARRWEIGILSDVGTMEVRPGMLRIEGEPSPYMRDMLARYGLASTAVGTPS
ncbi:hypothetical protein [Demequina sp. NBRC 110055]|uniref:hypothetical protein n=1 Tax=Demequina sp. NBRC 110055 TaxID=1570344 RepID=UPI001186A6B3|nr:hypothetical protein [Demequina sp. NBRC 110055]